MTIRTRPARTAPHRSSWSRWALGLALCVAGSAAAAQVSDGGLTILPNLELRGRGWTQITNVTEMLDFALALAEIAVLTLAISLHPVNLANRRTRADYERPRTLFLYGLIGMTVGFLVLHHGYIIGFVIFGMGGLLRFRSDATSTADTTRLILMTLLGLTVGLDLPVIAFFATLIGWLAIYAFGRQPTFEVEVKFSDKKDVQRCVDRLTEALREDGFTALGTHKAKFKPVVSLVLRGRPGLGMSDLADRLAGIKATARAPIEDWHVE
ncbi:MAG: hypothetical protein NXH83_10615 [Rhodobacteraceae bacterium]|nr:hypothetical protein [Paracoccaceae bacterium]